MASITTSLLFVSSIFLLNTLTNAVSDSDLTLVCSKTNQPNICQQTLKSDPTFSTTDIHGLGDISLKKATDKSKFQPQYLGSVSARAEAALAAKYAACSKDYETVIIAKLTEAGTSFRSGSVAAASQAVKAAFDQIGTCLNRFNQPPKDLSQFTENSLEIQTLCQAFIAVAGLLGR